MSRVVKRAAPEPPKPENVVPMTRAEIMHAYAERQMKRGHRQVKVWVPAHMLEWFRRIADDARTLHEVGTDPMTRVPAYLIERGDDKEGA